MKKKLLVCAIMCCFFMLKAENFRVNTNVLNIRESPHTTASVISQLNQNDHVEGEKLENGWIKLDNNKGFVNGKHVISSKRLEASVYKDSIWEIFKSHFIYFWIGVSVIFGLLYAGKKTKKDNRFSKGYNEKTLESNTHIGGVIGLIIGTPVAFIITLIYSIYTYFVQ